MKTHLLNARINQKAYAVLTELTEKLHTTKGYLTEKAIFLLKEHFDEVELSVGSKKAPDIFLSMFSKNIQQYNELYEKLREEKNKKNLIHLKSEKDIEMLRK